MFDLDMGRYAAFVWPAWGITAVVLGAVVARCVAEARRWRCELDRVQGPDQ
ncbi:heme exporter protein CcmD [Brevundimonas sp. A19_0]|uniref:heme exporter protein CcmD n=1 Tax=Brevundimonas sp. A19_0 TaxID=2821087 RepID=UPI001ADBCE2E|nr:heme exporter protein CcmD [Brevundimonas sp. A19_0]MBO9501357.1 heme exporter protein CcmD [Brevundimonas sp. A19_0]